MTPLIHIARAADWAAQKARQAYEPSAYGREGFVHCCWPGQVDGVVKHHFKDARDLVLLMIDPSRLQAPLVEELAPHGELFPHVYGPLNREAVVEVRPLA